MPDGPPSGAVSGPDDLVQPFRIDPFALRGRLVRLGPTINRILSQHAYPEPVAMMLGEATGSVNWVTCWARSEWLT